MTRTRRSIAVLALTFGLLAGVFTAASTTHEVVKAEPAAAAAFSYCAGYASGWFPYVHAPWVNAFGSDEIDAWVTCVPPGTSVPWYDLGLSPYCGIDTIQLWRFWFTPQSQYHTKDWLLYGVNYQSGAAIGNWGNSNVANHQWSGYSTSSQWMTEVHTSCANFPGVDSGGWAHTATSWTRP